MPVADIYIEIFNFSLRFDEKGFGRKVLLRISDFLVQAYKGLQDNVSSYVLLSFSIFLKVR